MTPTEHRRRYVTNMAQMFAGIHRCASDGHPVCGSCWTRAQMTYDMLTNRQTASA